MKQTGVTLGQGKVKVSVVYAGDLIGVSFEPIQEPHAVGSFTGESGEWTPSENDVIVWLDNIEGARVLQDAVSHAIMVMVGIVPRSMVSDIPDAKPEPQADATAVHPDAPEELWAAAYAGHERRFDLHGEPCYSRKGMEQFVTDYPHLRELLYRVK